MGGGHAARVADLWRFIAGLDQASVMALFAHCASQTVNAVKQPWERKRYVRETVGPAGDGGSSRHESATVRAYLGRVTKARIHAAVRDALGDDAADRIEPEAARRKPPSSFWPQPDGCRRRCATL